MPHPLRPGNVERESSTRRHWLSQYRSWGPVPAVSERAALLLEAAAPGVLRGCQTGQARSHVRGPCGAPHTLSVLTMGKPRVESSMVFKSNMLSVIKATLHVKAIFLIPVSEK